ncbi:MAG: RnfABCDGE type electron transport complex subunit D [Gemmatimonadales bacterium]|nr:RnfABCDGE type electron transport complex subunit D [Gemmatimonadales bacterium]
MTPSLMVTASPHLKDRDTTPRIMWHVVLSLLPVIVVSGWYFGISALLVLVATTLGALLTERTFGRGDTLGDGSATITGLLLGLTLPAGMPLWMAFLGGSFGMGFGKLVFGGLGQNVFNPALIGRAFLQAAFPVAITTWPAAGQGFWALRGDTFALPFLRAATDALTEATPLGLQKFEATMTPWQDLVLGTTGGSLGETGALAILLGGAFLAWRRYLNWRIPISVLGSAAIFATVMHLVNPAHPDAVFTLFAGGLMLGAVYMATDLVTSPVTNTGRWIFGIGIGVLAVVIRLWGGLPEGVMYAILLMNAMVPFLNRMTQPRVFGSPGRIRG